MSSIENAAPTPTSPQLEEVNRTDLDNGHTVMYDIHTGEAHKAGDITLRFAPQLGRVSVDAVFLYNKLQGKGTASEVYRQLPSLPVEDGKTLTEAGYTVVSSDQQTDAGKALWSSLHRKGIAGQREDGRYELVAPVHGSNESSN